MATPDPTEVTGLLPGVGSWPESIILPVDSPLPRCVGNGLGLLTESADELEVGDVLARLHPMPSSIVGPNFLGSSR
jgi:hypothetical protein